VFYQLKSSHSSFSDSSGDRRYRLNIFLPDGNTHELLLSEINRLKSQRTLMVGVGNFPFHVRCQGKVRIRIVEKETPCSVLLISSSNF
jgi:hypothetical protein